MPSILVIDDSQALLGLVAETLRSAGYWDVRTAEDWSGCRRALARAAPDLVIVDVRMPGMASGDVLAAQLRKDPRAAQARILLYSASSERDLAALAERCRADGWLRKGNLAALLNRVREILGPPPPRD